MQIGKQRRRISRHFSLLSPQTPQLDLNVLRMPLLLPLRKLRERGAWGGVAGEFGEDVELDTGVGGLCLLSVYRFVRIVEMLFLPCRSS